MGDAASQMAAQEALAAGAAPGRGFSVPGALAAAATAAPGTVQAWAQGSMGDGSNGQLQEPALLAQLVQLLGQRPRHSLLLSDLGALLPGPLRHGVKEKGGLRSWLQKYPELFQVSGMPGKESVTLLLGGSSDRMAAGAGAAKSGGRADAARGSEDAEARRDEEEEENEAAVQMRGLPYRAQKADVRRFLGTHTQALKEGDASIQLVANRDGRPSGFARVQFDSPAAARAARDSLHMRVMEVANPSPGSTGGTGSGAQDRYVEVFLYSERPNKLRIKKLTSGGGVPISEEEALEAAKVSKDQVVAECREHMMCPGKGQLLLSMLGVALSDGARLYLKKTDQGLKQFLAQYPQEFTVDGIKGRECVTYLPAVAKGSINNSDLPASFTDGQKKTRRAEQGTGGPSSGSINDLQRFHQRRDEPSFMPQSPKVTEKLNVDTPKELATPSDWGTPQPGPYLPGYDPARNPLVQRTGAEAAGMPVMGLNGQRPDGMLAAPAGAQSVDDWTAWAMPPPNFWAEPPCWPQDGGATMPWGSIDGQAMGVLQPLPMQMPTPLAATTVPAAMPGMLTAIAPMGVAHGQGAPQQAPPDPKAPAAVQLKGLPYSASEQDVLAFFAKHDVVDRVSEAPNAVDITKKPNGKPSGQAVVHMMSLTDAHVALRVLNGQHMDGRYIEVSHYSEGTGAGAQCSPRNAVGAAASLPGSDVGGQVPAVAAVAAAAAAPMLQLPAATCGVTVRGMEAQGIFDGASDTGGSGCSGSAGLVAAFPQAAAVWWTAPTLDAGAQKSPIAPVPTPGLAVVSSPNAELCDVTGLDVPVQATNEVVGSGDGDEQERWEALFNFLKRDGEPPAAAAMSALASPDAAGAAMPSLAMAEVA